MYFGQRMFEGETCPVCMEDCVSSQNDGRLMCGFCGEQYDNDDLIDDNSDYDDDEDNDDGDDDDGNNGDEYAPG